MLPQRKKGRRSRTIVSQRNAQGGRNHFGVDATIAETVAIVLQGVL